MLPFPPEWAQHLGVHVVATVPPGGGGRFRAHERLRPQPSFASIVESILAADPDFHAHEIGETLRPITAEGEYAAWVKIAGHRDGRPARRFVGAVFLGDFATALDCLALVPEKFVELERQSLELLHASTFSMAVRPRAFPYAPPPGWHGIPSGMTASWYPLDYPRSFSTIVVPPATPIDGDEAAAVEQAMADTGAGITVDGTAREAIVSTMGVRGTYLRVTGHRQAMVLHRELAAFAVFPFLYQMRLETAHADRLPALGELLRAVAASFQTLPTAGEGRPIKGWVRSTQLADQWVG
jgi:hypothetical protein